MAKLERTYNVPLRRGYVNTPRHKRAKKAVSTLRKFLSQHMKSDDIRLGQELNKKVWGNGMKNPPHHVKVKAVKDNEGIVKAELEGFEYKEAVQPVEQEADQGLASKLMGGAASKATEEKENKKDIEAAAKKDDNKKAEKKAEDKADKKPAKKSSDKKSSSKKSGNKKPNAKSSKAAKN